MSGITVAKNHSGDNDFSLQRGACNSVNLACQPY